MNLFGLYLFSRKSSPNLKQVIFFHIATFPQPMVIEELELPGDDERDDSVCEALGVAHKSLSHNGLVVFRVIVL